VRRIIVQFAWSCPLPRSLQSHESTPLDLLNRTPNPPVNNPSPNWASFSFFGFILFQWATPKLIQNSTTIMNRRISRRCTPIACALSARSLLGTRRAPAQCRLGVCSGRLATHWMSRVDRSGAVHSFFFFSVTEQNRTELNRRLIPSYAKVAVEC
jgi:hypothetical protein